MESGNQKAGLGSIQWWGFSPATDLAQFTANKNEELNVLLVGPGDVRHVLRTVAENPGRKINFYIYEAQVECIARHLLLLLATVASEPNGAYSLQNKTALYLDIFGNTLLRPASQSYLFQKSRVLSEMVTDSSYCKKRASFVELDRLKFKDRDRLDDQFVFWRSAKENFMVSQQWDIRQRQYMGARYDAREGAYDWDLQMGLHDRGAKTIMKHEYKNFRATGVAFSPEENENHEAPNRSLSSSKVMGDGRGDKNAYRGYWGDVVVGPYITHGVETENKELTKLVNGRPSNSSEMIAKFNINELFTKIHGSSNDEDEIETKLVKKREIYSSAGFENCSVNFLSPTSFDDISESADFKAKFDVISLSVSHCQKLSHSIIQNCLKPESHIFAETPQFITDLNKEQLASTLKIIKQLGIDSKLTEIEDNSLKGLLVFTN